MRDVNSGWAVRYTHANVASFFFIFVYAQKLKFQYKLYNQLIRVYYYTEEILNNFLSLFTPKTLYLKKAPKFMNNISNYDGHFLQWLVGFRCRRKFFNKY